MIKTARLTLATAKTETREQTMKQVLDEALTRAGVTKADIWLSLGSDYGLNTHFGNWCLVPVLDNEASAKVAAALGTELDLQRQILEASDLKKFKAGDKVNVSFTSGFGFPVKSPGKVLRVSDTEITILKGRSQSKGWKFNVDSEVTLEKI